MRCFKKRIKQHLIPRGDQCCSNLHVLYIYVYVYLYVYVYVYVYVYIYVYICICMYIYNYITYTYNGQCMIAQASLIRERKKHTYNFLNVDGQMHVVQQCLDKWSLETKTCSWAKKEVLWTECVSQHGSEIYEIWTTKSRFFWHSLHMPDGYVQIILLWVNCHCYLAIKMLIGC